VPGLAQVVTPATKTLIIVDVLSVVRLEGAA